IVPRERRRSRYWASPPRFDWCPNKGPCQIRSERGPRRCSLSKGGATWERLGSPLCWPGSSGPKCRSLFLKDHQVLLGEIVIRLDVCQPDEFHFFDSLRLGHLMVRLDVHFRIFAAIFKVDHAPAGLQRL